MFVHLWLRVSTLLLTAILSACGGALPQSSSAQTPGPTALSDQGTAPGAVTGRPASPADWRAFAAFLEQRATEGEFSGAVLVAKDGQPLLEQAYGLADRERTIANTVDTKFNIGSVGKTFTAVAIAQLAQQGKLAFNDPIGEYVSGFPPKIANRVTIHELLTHTSGLGDVLPNRTEVEKARTLSDLIDLIVKAPLEFEPGTRFSYSNSGFVVLGAIVERLSGQSYYDDVREQIFKPAGMNNTDWHEPGQQPPNLARGYMQVDEHGNPVNGPGGPPSGSAAVPGNLRDNGDFLPPGDPSGGASSTISDLLRFAQALLQHKLLSPELTNTVITGKVPAPRPGLADDTYAYGFADSKLHGVRIVGHNGGAPGVGAQLDIYPELGYIVVILTNYDGALMPVHTKTHEILTR
jgi:CubicO group peptidase (beta-lactamase class C family)